MPHLEFSSSDPMPHSVYTHCGKGNTVGKESERALYPFAYSSGNTWTPCLREKTKKPCNF